MAEQYVHLVTLKVPYLKVETTLATAPKPAVRRVSRKGFPHSMLKSTFRIPYVYLELILDIRYIYWHSFMPFAL
jgi:hypothetical protein